MKAIWSVFVVLLAGVAGAQFKNGSKEYQIEPPITNVEIAWTWRDGGEPSHVFNLASLCYNVCQGKKHLTHQVCDSSCDRACGTLHQTTFSPWRAEEYFGDEVELQRALQRFGAVSTKEMAQAIMDAARNHVNHDLDKINVEFRSGCWNTKPCHYWQKALVTKTKICTVKITPLRETVIDGRVIRTNGPSVTKEYGILVPTDEVITSYEGTICRCELLVPRTPDQEDQEVGHLPSGDPVPQEETAVCTSEGMDRPLTTEDFKQCAFEVSAESMNYANVALTSAPSDCSQITFPAGWEFECSEGGGQNTVLADNLVLAAPGQTKSLSAVRVRTLCLDITKPEPRPNMTYRIVPPGNPYTVWVARVARESRIRGPWDQMRLWMVTNGSTYEDIAKTLFPAPSAREYVREFRTNWALGALNLSDPDVWKRLKREYVFETVLDEETALWFAREHLRRERGPFRELLLRGGSRLAQSAGQPNGVAHVGAVLQALVEAGEIDLALDLISQMPAAIRASLLETGASMALGVTLMNTLDPETATKVLDWYAADPAKAPALALLNPSKELPEEVRARARSMVSPQSDTSRHAFVTPQRG